MLISIGGEADANLSTCDLTSSSTETTTSITGSLQTPTRLLSCFRRGFILLLAQVLNRLPLTMGSLIPQFSGQLSFW